MTLSPRYEVRIKAPAEREMDRLDPPVFSRITQAILFARDQSEAAQLQETANREEYRLRVGAYRVLYTINDKTRVVEIVAVGHRREVYR